jgi:hypothetical protein
MNEWMNEWCFWTLSIVLFLLKTWGPVLFKTHRFGDWILSPSSGKTPLSPVDTASPYLRTIVPSKRLVLACMLSSNFLSIFPTRLCLFFGGLFKTFPLLVLDSWSNKIPRHFSLECENSCNNQPPIFWLNCCIKSSVWSMFSECPHCLGTMTFETFPSNLFDVTVSVSKSGSFKKDQIEFVCMWAPYLELSPPDFVSYFLYVSPIPLHFLFTSSAE